MADTPTKTKPKKWLVVSNPGKPNQFVDAEFEDYLQAVQHARKATHQGDVDFDVMLDTPDGPTTEF